MKFGKDAFVKGSLILFAATFVLNISGYLFHVLMGRVLGPESYGILGVLLSILYIIAIPTNVIQLSLSKFVSEYRIKNSGMINTLVRRSYRKLFFIGLAATLAMMGLSFPLSAFLKIDIVYLFLLSPTILFAFLVPINRSVFQGLQKFTSLGTNLVGEGFSKLAFGAILVIIGFGVGGAILALSLSFLLPIILGIFPLKCFLKKTSQEVESKAIYKYSFPVLFSLIFLTGLYTIDVFLVKHFFSDLQAGYYVAASLLGKIILFITISISTVLFPQSVEAFTLKNPTKKLLKKALLLAALPCIAITIGYFMLPELAILLLFGEAYYPMASIVGLFGLAMSLFSFIYLLSLYNLSVNRKEFIYFVFFALVAETILIYSFHSSLQQVLVMLNFVFIALLITISVYTIKKQ